MKRTVCVRPADPAPPRRSRSVLAAASAILAAGLATFAAPQAEAKIRCDGAYQIIKGHGQIATPYCGDNYLGQVARGYGIRVSNSEIRNNPNRKAEICRHIGHDIRVQDICAGLRDDNGGRGFH